MTEKSTPEDLAKEEALRHEKVQTEINYLLAQTSKLNKEIKWYEIVIISGATLVIVAIVKLFL